MYRILTSSKDTYITNKIINNKFRATDANVGQAGTLDLFKLYAENISGSNTTPTELSRILIKFDLDQVKNMHNDKKIDVGDNSFKAYLKLFDVYGGQTTPNNFRVTGLPLAKPFDEGTGFDIVNFSDLDMTNWLSASLPSVNPSQASSTLTATDASLIHGLTAGQKITLISTDETVIDYFISDTSDGGVAHLGLVEKDSVLKTTGGVKATLTTGATGIAVGFDLGAALPGGIDQGEFMSLLAAAIADSTNGHAGKITTSIAGNEMTLTQATAGYAGNTAITEDLATFSKVDFSGGKGGVEAWHGPGARKIGNKGDINIDAITSGTLHSDEGLINLGADQFFVDGTEDLVLDFTNFVSGVVKNQIDNHGFVIGFSTAFEDDTKTYFVKRFASRDALNKNLRPQLTIQYDDTLQDNHSNFEFNTTGSLYLNNFTRGSFSNILSGAAGIQLTGENCMILKIQSGSFKKQFDVSQVLRGASSKATSTITIDTYTDLAEGDSFTITDYLNESTTFQINLIENTTTQSSASCDLTVVDHTQFTDGDTFILSASDDTGYEFTISTGTDRTALTIDRGLFASADATRDAIIAAINHADASSSTNLVASSGGSGIVTIKQIVAGSSGNQTNSTNLTNGVSFFTLANFSKGYDNAIGINGLTTDAAVAEQFHNAIDGNATTIESSYTTSETTVTLTQPVAGTAGNKNVTDNLTTSTVSNFTGGTFSGLTGIYSSSFAINNFDSNLYDHVLASGSIQFDEIWSNHNETATYLSSSLKITTPNRSAITYSENRINVSIVNLRQRYKEDDTARIRVYAQNADKEIPFVKKPIKTPSEIFSNMFYRVRDADNGKIIIPFDDTNNATKLSSDSEGMYFDFFMSSLPPGRAYVFDFLIKTQGYNNIIKDVASKFIVE